MPVALVALLSVPVALVPVPLDVAELGLESLLFAPVLALLGSLALDPDGLRGLVSELPDCCARAEGANAIAAASPAARPHRLT